LHREYQFLFNHVIFLIKKCVIQTHIFVWNCMLKNTQKMNSKGKVNWLSISSKHSQKSSKQCQKSSKQCQKSSKQKALMLIRNECLLENLVSTNKSNKQIMESSKQIIKDINFLITVS